MILELKEIVQDAIAPVLVQLSGLRADVNNLRTTIEGDHDAPGMKGRLAACENRLDDHIVSEKEHADVVHADRTRIFAALIMAGVSLFVGAGSILAVILKP